MCMDKKVSIAKGIKVTGDKLKSMKKKPGGSNVGKYSGVKKSDFASKTGGAPEGSFPINTLARAKSALKLAHNAPEPAKIKKAVYSKYPSLKKAPKE